MQGRSQGNPYPGHSSRHTSWVSQKHPVNCGNAESSWACREREITAPDVCQNRTGTQFSDAASGPSRSASHAVSTRTHTRGAGVQRVAFADSQITLEYACARSARAETRIARREWIERAGEAPANLPMWTSRDGWLNEVAAWLATDDGLAVCARLHIKPERVLRAAIVLAAHADHATGRNCAVANSTVAAGAGCSERTVTNARQVLGASGLAVLIQQGHGSPNSPRSAWRPAIWHLVSRPKPVDNPPAGPAVCDLPPSRRDERLSPVKSHSPNARTRASQAKSSPPKKAPAWSGRCAPRPLAVQRLADELVGNAYGRKPLCHGLDRGHIGAVCDAIMSAGIDPDIWSAEQLKNALNADMKIRGWSWPDRIERPGAFLAARLRLLPVLPAAAPADTGPNSEHVLSSQDNDRETDVDLDALVQRWYADVTAVTTPQDRQTLLRAHEAKFGAVLDPFAALANAGRRAARQFPELPLAEGLMRWAHDELAEEPTGAVAERVLGATSLSTDLLMDLAIDRCDCVVCGSPNAVQRPQLPLRAMSTVCDQCWPVIAAELAQASDIDEEMLA